MANIGTDKSRGHAFRDAKYRKATSRTTFNKALEKLSEEDYILLNAYCMINKISMYDFVQKIISQFLKTDQKIQKLRDLTEPETKRKD